MFRPKALYCENGIENYELGRELLEKYQDVPKIQIDNHNNIEEMRKKQNSEFPDMKRNLIIGIRKTHKFVENHKTSDYLVPYTSSGCTAMCMYCYLVCNYNKCAYLRLFVNREQMLEKIIKTANKSEKDLVFEIGSNSDLILENTITKNLIWTIENFANTQKGKLTFPTKFEMIDDLLNIRHNKKIIIRMSVNPEEIINKVEFGTSRLKQRIQAINKLADADYPIGILIAPVIFVENWKSLYLELIKYLYDRLSENHRIKIITPRDSTLLTFYVPDMHILDFGASVGARGVCLRVGNMCASWIHRALGLNGTARISVGAWNTMDDVVRAADIIENGIVLTGGGALIEGLDKLIEKELKVPTKIADSPLTCVAEGTGIILDSLT